MVTTVAAMMSTITIAPAIMATVLSKPELATVGGEVVIDTPGPTGAAKKNPKKKQINSVSLLVCY